MEICITEKLRAIPALRRFFAENGNTVLYVGGSDVLPAPLSTEEEREMLFRMGEEDTAARASLIEHNLRLVVYIAKKFDNTGVGVEDLISIGTIGLIKSINTFAPNKNIKRKKKQES